jgi:hypothetical protein
VITEDTPNIKRYREFELKLGQIREKHKGADSDEEDAHLDVGDSIWWDLNQEEEDYLRKTKSPHYDYVVKYI